MKLDKYYVITRYPNGLPGLIPAEYFDEDEASKAITSANAIIEHASQRMALLQAQGNGDAQPTTDENE